MDLLQLLKNSISILIGGASFVGTFYTMIDLMYFLSSATKNTLPPDYNLSISKGLLVNMILLTLFVLQHSFLNETLIKSAANKFGIGHLSRCFYVLSTCVVLQALMCYWHGIRDVTLWQWNLNFSCFWYLYVVLHLTAWIIIYVGNICMDVNELLGIKQIYYSLGKLPDPNSRKSVQLQRLNSHMRHPSVIAFLILFWSVPVMSIDRLLLAFVWTLYMFIAYRTDDIDYAYQKAQYIRKFHELERLDH